MSAQSSGSATLLMFVFLGVIALVGVFGVPQFAPVAASPSNRTSDRLSGRFGPMEKPAVDTPPPTEGAADLFAPLERDAEARFGADENGLTSLDRENLLRPVMTDNRTSQPRGELSRRAELPGEALDGWDFQSGAAGEPVDAAAGDRQFNSDLSESGFQRSLPAKRTSAPPFPALAESEGGLSRDEEPVTLGREPDRQAAPAGLTELQEEMQSRPIAFGKREIVRSGGTDDSAPDTADAREPLTWRAAVAKLNALGIRDYQLSPGERPNDFHFGCFFMPADNPRITHRFEAEADQPLEAVAKVLAQIDAWLAERQRTE